LVDEIVETEILVIGGGLAGCMAAIEASDLSTEVILAVEGKVGKSGCTPLAGGPGGADFMVDSASVSTVLGLDDIGPEKPDLMDSPELFKEDILLDGTFLNNQKMLDVYVAESPKRMKRLIELGLRIREVNSAHGVRFPRGIISLNTDISSALIRNVKKRPITLLEDTKITDLLTKKGRCVGAVGVKVNSGDIVEIRAKAVVIATGAWQMAYNTGGSDDLTGDGQAMAFKAGAELVDMEFSTIMDRYLVWPPYSARDHSIWKWSTEKKVVNSEGDDFLSVIPPEDRRRLTARAISEEISKGRGTEHGGVYLRNPDESIANAFLKMRTLLDEWHHDNIDFEISVGSHYFNGGVRVNEKTETALPGLYAAGEASGGLFGARRIASALSEATIQGAIAGENAVKFAESVEITEADAEQVKRIQERLLAPLRRDSGVKPVELRMRMRETTLKALCAYRSEQGLQKALTEIRKMRINDVQRLWVSGTKSRRFNKEWIECLSLDSLLLCTEASARAALMREESRGFHYRKDFPEQNDQAWLKNIILKRLDDEMITYAEPIVVTDMPPRRG